ncbi:hypothetical protein NPIL_280961 [Nephila pilipes]|uniref:Uncharacterized protein n=1 Tax=Nephila pilipes TaxID=299642 RepID=A0A8X6II08_NEPPI|nr:hypothetical protein NPIL_280961 [Nephila pilipes]
MRIKTAITPQINTPKESYISNCVSELDFFRHTQKIPPPPSRGMASVTLVQKVSGMKNRPRGALDFTTLHSHKLFEATSNASIPPGRHRNSLSCGAGFPTDRIPSELKRAAGLLYATKWHHYGTPQDKHDFHPTHFFTFFLPFIGDGAPANSGSGSPTLGVSDRPDHLRIYGEGERHFLNVKSFPDEATHLFVLLSLRVRYGDVDNDRVEWVVESRLRGLLPSSDHPPGRRGDTKGGENSPSPQFCFPNE